MVLQITINRCFGGLFLWQDFFSIVILKQILKNTISLFISEENDSDCGSSSASKIPQAARLGGEGNFSGDAYNIICIPCRPDSVSFQKCPRAADGACYPPVVNISFSFDLELLLVCF